MTALGIIVLFWLFVIYAVYRVVTDYIANRDPIPALGESAIAFLCCTFLWVLGTELLPYFELIP